MLKIYHNPRCKKSREALEFLKNKKLDYQIHYYLENRLTSNELKSIIEKINLKPSDIVRKNEKDWKAIPNRNDLTENEILRILVLNPKLIERPIVTNEKMGVLARPLENLFQFIEKIGLFTK